MNPEEKIKMLEREVELLKQIIELKDKAVAQTYPIYVQPYIYPTMLPQYPWSPPAWHEIVAPSGTTSPGAWTETINTY